MVCFRNSSYTIAVLKTSSKGCRLHVYFAQTWKTSSVQGPLGGAFIVCGGLEKPQKGLLWVWNSCKAGAVGTNEGPSWGVQGKVTCCPLDSSLSVTALRSLEGCTPDAKVHGNIDALPAHQHSFHLSSSAAAPRPTSRWGTAVFQDGWRITAVGKKVEFGRLWFGLCTEKGARGGRNGEAY